MCGWANEETDESPFPTILPREPRMLGKKRASRVVLIRLKTTNAGHMNFFKPGRKEIVNFKHTMDISFF